MPSLVIAIFAFLLFLPVQAIDKFTAAVNKNTIRIDEELILTLTIRDSKLKELVFPTDTADYKATSQSSSTNIEMINGHMSQQKTITLTLQPKHLGTFNLPSAEATLQGIKYRTPTISITVDKAQAKPASQTKPNPRTARSSSPRRSSSRSSSPRNTKTVFARLSTNKSSPYLNEQVLLKLKIYHRGNLRNISLPDISLDDFVSKKLEQTFEYSEILDGMEYLVYEIDFVLFPIKAGALEIPATDFLVSVMNRSLNPFDPFSHLSSAFNIDQEKTLTTNSLKFNVKELPANAPKSFTGYVGSLSVNYKAKQNSVQAGDAVDFNVEIYGNGNANNLVIDDLIEESQLYSTYKDKDAKNFQVNNKVEYFSVHSKLAIVANQNSRKIAIKTKAISNFDPINRKYITHEAQEFLVDILGTTAGSADNTSNSNLATKQSKATKKQKAKEILFYSSDQILKYKSRLSRVNFLFLVLALINLLLFFDTFLKKMIRAFKPAYTSETRFKDVMQAIKKTEEFAVISQKLKDLVQNLDLTRLSEKSPDLKDALNVFLSDMDKLNYSNTANLGFENEINNYRKEAINLVKRLKDVYV